MDWKIWVAKIDRDLSSYSLMAIISSNVEFWNCANQNGSGRNAAFLQECCLPILTMSDISIFYDAYYSESYSVRFNICKVTILHLTSRVFMLMPKAWTQWKDVLIEMMNFWQLVKAIFFFLLISIQLEAAQPFPLNLLFHGLIGSSFTQT